MALFARLNGFSMANHPANDAPYRLIRDTTFGDRVFVHSFTNLYGCEIGADTRIGPFVEIQQSVMVGARCKIQSHTFICSGVAIADDVFISHGVMFVNDRRPRATRPDKTFQTAADWALLPVTVGQGVSIGTGAVILGGVTIGHDALVGAGAVVTRDVSAGETVFGVPARLAPRSESLRDTNHRPNG
jgi:UDP-2-acetamido-3-amino-2,3-dideoxy-glucuronate N-acetyltransferase